MSCKLGAVSEASTGLLDMERRSESLFDFVSRGRGMDTYSEERLLEGRRSRD